MVHPSKVGSVVGWVKGLEGVGKVGGEAVKKKGEMVGEGRGVVERERWWGKVEVWWGGWDGRIS